VQQDTSGSTYHLCGSSAVVCNWLALNYTAVAPPNCKQCELPVVGNLGLHESRVEMERFTKAQRQFANKYSNGTANNLEGHSLHLVTWTWL